MTLKQQQRLIGTLLLVFFIAVLAYIVLSKVSRTESERQIPEEDPIQFSSVIEPMQEKPAEDENDSDTSFTEEAFVEIDPEVKVEDDSEELSPVPEPGVTQPVVEPEAVAPEPIAEAPKEPEPAPKQAPAPKPAPEPTPEPEPKPVPEPEPKSVPEPKLAATPAKPDVSSTTTAEVPTDVVSGWILQLGSFSVESNATSLKKQLEELGYKPMIEQTRSGGSVIYRVRLQPNSDRATLEKTAESIRNKLNLNTQIFPYP